MLKINSFVYILPLIVATSTILAMDQSQKTIIHGKLLIADKKSLSKDPRHNICGSNPVTCLTKANRQTYPYTETIAAIPLNSPIVYVILEPNDPSKDKIFTIMPATKLLCLNNESQLDFPTTPDCTLRLTCAKNPALIIEPKYLPENMQAETFATDFSGSMKEFYTKPTYCPGNLNVQELVQARVLQENRHATLSPTDLFNAYLRTGDRAFLLMSSGTITTYTHGENGCTKPEHLTNLATKCTTEPYGKSSFDYVMGRQTGKPISHAQPINPAETARLTCYYNYLENNVKHVGDKSPMQKTIHFFKNPSLDKTNKVGITADKTLEEEILENALIEFAAQETALASQPTNKTESITQEASLNPQPTRKAGDCALL
jgi:hypothetical protein